MISQPTRILQLTDLHLFGDPKISLVGFNSYQSLQRIMLSVADSIAKKPPSLLALTGDISQDYSLASYEIAKKIFHNFPCKIAATMGNHDYSPTFIDFFGDPTQDSNKLFTLNDWRILFLNSNWPGHVGGQLAQIELDFLRRTLATSCEQCIIIFLHHPVLPVGSYWLDKIMTNNAAQFLEIIDQYHNIKAVICGHTHQETNISRLGVTYLSTPATSWQFAVQSYNFKLDTLMPGYRLIDLYKDGTFQTEVVRINYDDAFVPDLNSKGY
ncbi:3',5'-cyclic adenosine monophosphate phosphodiesterase CpdA [Gammaproteobacteria bacterium]